MKVAAFLFIAIVLTVAAVGQSTNPKYDSALAHKLGADDYGMKNYVFVILKPGDNKSTDKQLTDSCFGGHLKNIQKLAAQKQLIIAGPFGKNENDYSGLFVLNVSSFDEARKLLESDPAINQHFLSADLYPWYGSAALPEYLEASDKIWKKGF